MLSVGLYSLLAHCSLRCASIYTLHSVRLRTSLFFVGLDSLFAQRSLKVCAVFCLSSKYPGNLVSVHDIMNSIKYQDIFNRNLAAPAGKLNLGRRLPAGQ